MIQFVKGNLLEAEAEALINTVNTVGVMGKGIALQFRKAFPRNYAAYTRAVKYGEVKIGKMFVFEQGELSGPQFIINFPTKEHWKSKSKLEDIKSGLFDLIEVVKKYRIQSIAIPPLGCGNGGLDWNDVRSLIQNVALILPEVVFMVYPPQESPLPEKMKNVSSRPTWTAARAALLGVLERYCEPGYRLSMLEIQKLVYFLQVVGEPMKLQFVKGKYGPYAENLHHLLQRLDGHFIQGYGDRSKEASINLISQAVDEAREILIDNRGTQARIDKISKLIEGFETPYGLELLSSVHWLVKENPTSKTNVSFVVQGVQDWNEHKRKTFKTEHIQIAWNRLQQFGWLEDIVAH
jgi:O-acetyl-ADP-ribose deacetylase (regulator of RNase III)